MSNVIKNFDGTGTARPTRKFEMTEIAADCEQMLSSARQTAEHVMAEARRAAAKVREQAYREGWETGRREAQERVEGEAVRELRREYGERVKGMLATLDKLAGELQGQREPMLKATRDDLMKLALRIAGMVVKKEVEAPGVVARLNLEEAIELSAKRTELVARVSEKDMEALELVAGELAQRVGPGGKLRLVADPEVMPGGCVVQSVRGEVDASIETQMGEIEKTLVGE